MVDEGGVLGRSEVEVDEGAGEGVTTCEGVDPEDVAGTSSSRDPYLGCTGTNRICLIRKISTLRLDGMYILTMELLWYPTKCPSIARGSSLLPEGRESSGM